MLVFRAHRPRTIATLVPKRPRTHILTNHKLQPEHIPEIRRLLAHGYSHPRIAKHYGVTRSTIGRVARGESWAWVA